MATNWEKNLVRKPRYEVTAGDIKGRQYPTMTLMSNDLVPGSNTYIELGWIWEKLTRPHLQIAMVLGAGTMAEADPGGHVKQRGEG